MKKVNVFLLAITALVLVSSCKKDKEDENVNPSTNVITQSTFSFMKQDAKWVYNTFDSQDPGIIVEESYTISSMGTDGWAGVEWKIGGMVIQTVEWYADNNVFCNLAQKSTNKKLNLTTSNPAVSDSWSETWSTSTGTVTNTRTVVAVNETVVVPAGTYNNCVKVRETTSEDSVYYKYYWFNQQYGIIKTEGTTAEDYPVILYSELKTVSL